MYDLTIVGSTAFFLAFTDIILHIILDIRKMKTRQKEVTPSSQFTTPSLAIAAVGISTLLSFFLVLIIILLWFGLLNQAFIQLLIPLVDSPDLLWITGFVILSSGIVMHGWSRVVRGNFASSWEMGEHHRLVISGPYARIRHPSYLSYFMCFLGLILMIPSVVTLLLLMGFPGYYSVARVEEVQLEHHFGEEYTLYKQRTGMFLPRIRSH